MLGVGAIPGVLMLAAVAAVPESPRWYLLRGRTADAERTHHRLSGGRAEALPADAGTTPDLGWRDLFCGHNRMVLVVASGLFAFANLSGINAILYYAPAIFAEVGFGGTLGPFLATSGIGVVNVAATILAMGLIDRIGRRPLPIGGLVPMALSLLVLAVALRGAGMGIASATAWGVNVLVSVTGSGDAGPLAGADRSQPGARPFRARSRHGGGTRWARVAR